MTKVRLNLEIVGGTKDQMFRLKEKMNVTSIASVIRVGVHLLELLIDADRNGDEIILRSKDGSEKVIKPLF